MGNFFCSVQEETLSQTTEERSYHLLHRVFAEYQRLEGLITYFFNLHDIDREGEIPNDVLEPALRHILYAIGLFRFQHKFHDKGGSLKTHHVMGHLKKNGIDVNKNLTLNDWKIVVCSWIELYEDAEKADLEEEQRELAEMQRQREIAIQKALDDYVDRHSQNMEAQWKAIEAQQAKEKAEREEWIRNVQLQEAFYNEQMGFCQKANHESQIIWEDVIRRQKTAEDALLAVLKPQRKSAKVITYCYRIPPGRNFGPISLGASVPRPVLRGKAKAQHDQRVAQRLQAEQEQRMEALRVQQIKRFEEQRQLTTHRIKEQKSLLAQRQQVIVA
eukprot:CAMPEP_0113860618 /NCGR_PEP_ID=MMETSP0372-20130328/13599_1 /TAXON_ID=340204 /ORGANISM="Lankesteria abbotti" /LENGTH=329 /DNA_ID=CAMNT_0000840165 /DNA_START=122 /DNA_END=1111 /DNA_ORIENTATION=+ /assembly_acc=CAM_ASM_000359